MRKSHFEDILVIDLDLKLKRSKTPLCFQSKPNNSLKWISKQRQYINGTIKDKLKIIAQKSSFFLQDYCTQIQIECNGKTENGSKLLAPQMRLILVPLNSVASAAYK